MAEAQLSAQERRLFLLLGAPSMGLSLAITTLSTYAPVLAHRFTSSRAVIGMLVGGEGLIALVLPIWVGALSDRVRSRLGRRLPFLVATCPVAVIALALLPFAPTLALMGVAVLFFYVAYLAYYAPYRALYPDLVRRDEAGRAQGIQGIFREIGLGVALVGGGLLMEVWRPLPYLLGAAVLLVTTAVSVAGLRSHPGIQAAPGQPKPDESPATQAWALLRDHRDIRWFVVANALWELTLAGLKSFIVLYLTVGLGKTMTFNAAVMGVIGVIAVLGSPLAGKLADRFGPVRVMEIALFVFGLGLLMPVLSHDVWLLVAALPFIAAGAITALTLPYALLMRRMPPGSHGAAAGLYDLSSGAGKVLGPAITGAAIDLLHPFFTATKGYGAMWPVVSASTLLSIPFLRAARRRR